MNQLIFCFVMWFSRIRDKELVGGAIYPLECDILLNVKIFASGSGFFVGGIKRCRAFGST